MMVSNDYKEAYLQNEPTYTKHIEEGQERIKNINRGWGKKGIKPKFHKSMDRLAANQNDHHHGYIESHECEALILTFLLQVKNHFESGTLIF